MIIDLTEIPQNLYCNIYRTGMSDGVRVKNIQWHLPVLAFIQPKQDSKDWYIVTFRTDTIKSPVDTYYTDKDIDYQIYYIGSNIDKWDTDKDNLRRTQIYKGEKESYDVMLEELYPRVKNIYEDRYKDGFEGGEFTDNSLYEFLVQHREYVHRTMPHTLL